MSVSDAPEQDVGHGVRKRFAAIVTNGASDRPCRNRDPYTTSASPRRIGSTSTASCCRIELEVGVLDRHHLAARDVEPHPDRVPLAAVPRRVHDAHALDALESLEHLTRPVARSVVDDDDLAGAGREIVSKRSMTAATVADSLNTGTMIEISNP
jgi:hypothetical protein